jgi:hypothetical protein
MKRGSIKKSTRIVETRDGKGLRLTIDVVAYDNGQLYIDGMPMMDRVAAAVAWTRTVETCAGKVIALQWQVAKRG